MKKVNVKKSDFLLEIGVEELPSLSLRGLSVSLGLAITERLQDAGLSYAKKDLYVTPRRIAVLITDLVAKQESRLIEKRGPGVDRAFDADGKPTKACLGFAKSCGVEVDELERLDTDSGSWVLYRKQQEGALTKDLLADIVKSSLKSLHIAKPMHWGDNPESFVRPVHWVVMLYGKSVIDAELFGIKSGNKTYGHRFHHPEAIVIKEPCQYATLLIKQGRVIADLEQRKEVVRHQFSQLAGKNKTVVVDEKLLEEVTGVVEWPVALLCSFDKRFLKMPADILIAVMKVHQRCFYVVDHDGNMVANFVAVANIESKNKDRVISGNERVMTARLADAEFFYNGDSDNGLETYVGELKDVVFQNNLGTLHDKMERVRKIATLFAKDLEADQEEVKRAAFLCKADLVTEMVGEFPELQGIMGYHYAMLQQEPQAVAVAIKEHYLPRFSGDKLPETPIGIVLALADRFDSLVGIFGINELPTGDKDPFALRRAALGVVRIILEYDLACDLKDLVGSVYSIYKESGLALPNGDVVDQVVAFVFERLRGILAEDGVTTNIFNAVLANNPTSINDFEHRIYAIEKFLNLPEAETLIATHKRINNILKKASLPANYSLDITLFKEPIEKELYNVLLDLKKVATPLHSAGFYSEVLTFMASIKPTIDEFFDKVMVMVDDEALRNNRLALLSDLRDVLGSIAEISIL